MHPGKGSRPEPCRPLLVHAVPTELLRASFFFPAGNQRVHEEHRHVHDENQIARPNQERSEPDDGQGEVLGMSSHRIEAAGDEPSLPALCSVELGKSEEEQDTTNYHQRPTEVFALIKHRA